MTVVAPLGGAALRALGRSRSGRRLGTVAYSVAAELTARGWARVDGVSSAVLMGALARGLPVDPGLSDIDVVLACDFGSVESEIRTLSRLREWQRRLMPLGGLFYNLDCLDEREVPFARAFGGAWEMRLEEEGKCLAGRRLWREPAVRPARERRRERLSYMLRRWLNTAARLLDPRVPLGVTTIWDARRLVLDIAWLWAGVDVEQASDALVDTTRNDPALSATSELARLGAEKCGMRELRSVLVTSALEMLEAFTREVTAGFSGELARDDEGLDFTPSDALQAVGRAVIGGPFESFMLLQRGPFAGGALPVAVAAEGATAAEVVEAFAARMHSAARLLSAVERTVRRPVPFSATLWRALPLLEPAPFLGAAAVRPLWRVGRAVDPPPAPDPQTLSDVLTSSVVQSFVLCRWMELRPAKAAWMREQGTRERFALLPALDRALDERVFDLPIRAMPDFSLEMRTETLHDFSERHRARLAPARATPGTE
jgi:hypothetical protein